MQNNSVFVRNFARNTPSGSKTLWQKVYTHFWSGSFKNCDLIKWKQARFTLFILRMILTENYAANNYLEELLVCSNTTLSVPMTKTDIPLFSTRGMALKLKLFKICSASKYILSSVRHWIFSETIISSANTCWALQSQSKQHSHQKAETINKAKAKWRTPEDPQY